jgi:hypothetical protein
MYVQGNVSIIGKLDVRNFAHGELVNKADLTMFDGRGSQKLCWKNHMDTRPCRAPHNDFVHLSAATKPWLRLPPVNFTETPEESPSHYWFASLYKLKEHLHLEIDFEHWKQHEKPVLGYHPKRSESLPQSHNANPEESLPDYAYVYVVGGVNPDDPVYRPFLYNILINTNLQRKEGSKADVVVFVQMSYASNDDKLPYHDFEPMYAMGIKLRYIPKTEYESFERLMFDKFRMLALTQYKRVMYLDGDMMVRGNMDYLFEQSVRGVLQKNVVFAGRLEPAIGGLFLLAPEPGDWARLMKVIHEKEERGLELPTPHFSNELGWGQPFINGDSYELLSGKKRDLWDFEGAPTDQGLLYHWVKYEKKSASIIMKDAIQNWGNSTDGVAILTETLKLDIFSGMSKQRECWSNVLAHKQCTAPHSDYVHFPGHKKAWMKVDRPNELLYAPGSTSPMHFWFQNLLTINVKLKLGVSLDHWERVKQPLLGARSNSLELAGTTYADSSTKTFASPYTRYIAVSTATRFAYAYVVGGCKPDDPSYRNYFNDILVSTYRQREEGSQADVVVFVQMAYESKTDTLPETDVKLLSAMNIKIEYIPKTKEESFYRIMLDKFRILSLTQYDRVLFMDGDVMAVGNLDYLFDLSMRGILKENLVYAGLTEPANGGFFMVAPKADARDRIMKIIQNKEDRCAKLPYPNWDAKIGWGHPMEDDDWFELMSDVKRRDWDFYGAFADQGLLFHWVKYEQKSVSVVLKDKIQNWGADSTDGTVRMEKELDLSVVSEHARVRPCWKEIIKFRQCLPPHSDFTHFTGRSKPWLNTPPPDLSEATASLSPQHFWFYTLSILNDKMGIGLDFTHWRTHHRPFLGMYPKHVEAAKTKYATE